MQLPTSPLHGEVDGTLGKGVTLRVPDDSLSMTLRARIQVRASDLVLLKLHAGGTQDLWDVKQLLDTDQDGEIAREVQSRIAEVPRGAAIAWKRIREG